MVINLYEIPQIYNTRQDVFGYTESALMNPTSGDMVMIKRVMMCAICLILLSACDTGGDNSSGINSNGVSGENYAPINLDTVTEATSGMVISGAIDHNTGEVEAFWIRLDRRLDSYRNIEVETRNGYLLRLMHPISLGEGTHPINTTLDTLPTDTNIAGGLLYLWSPDEAQQFTHNPQGSLTIRYQDEEIFGSFTMTAENLAGDSITINGQFFSQESDSAVRTN